MKRGWFVYGVLVGCVIFYATALRAAGMVVCLPAEQTVCTLTRQETQTVIFPALVEGTTLQVLNTVCYEGAFLENGSDTPIVGAMGILVENTGEKHVRNAWIMLTGIGKRYCFYAQDLPPGSRTILLETDGALWCQESFMTLSGGAQTAQEDLLRSGEVEIVPLDLGTVAVTNLSGRMLTDLELSYKNYLEDGDIYQGGIAYHYVIPALHPEQTIAISVDHYATGYSRFVYACCPSVLP